MRGRSKSWRRATPRRGAVGRSEGRGSLRARRDDRDQRGEPAGIDEVAASFIAAFPDITVYMDALQIHGELVRYDWTFTGTSSETGKWVRIPGSEEWTIGSDGLIAASTGTFDAAEYERQLREGPG